MQFDEQRARLGYRAIPDSRMGSGLGSRVGNAIARTVAVVAGVVMFASALVLSVAFFAVALAVVLLVGGYLWWRTRHLRRQMQAQFRDWPPPQDHDNVIEGEVISRDPASERSRAPSGNREPR